LKNGILANAATASVAEFARIPPDTVLFQLAVTPMAQIWKRNVEFLICGICEICGFNASGA
jgi:hypothetical protein